MLIPLLRLGLPSSATAAVLLTAFQQYCLQPGPLLFSARPDLVWTLIASLYVGNVMLLVFGLPLAPLWAARDAGAALADVRGDPGARVRRGCKPKSIDPGSGAAVSGGRRRLCHGIYDIPLVPAVLGLILGLLSEQQFRRAVAISEGDLSVFVTKPICATLLFLSCAVLFGPRLLRARFGLAPGHPSDPRYRAATLS